MRADEYDHSLNQVAGPDEEGIDCLLGVVLGFATRRQEQRLTCRVLNRIVRAVFEDLGPLQDDQHGQCEDRCVSTEGDQRQDEQRAAHADVLEHSRDHEGLQQEREDVHRCQHCS